MAATNATWLDNGPAYVDNEDLERRKPRKRRRLVRKPKRG